MRFLLLACFALLQWAPEAVLADEFPHLERERQRGRVPPSVEADARRIAQAIALVLGPHASDEDRIGALKELQKESPSNFNRGYLFNQLVTVVDSAVSGRVRAAAVDTIAELTIEGHAEGDVFGASVVFRRIFRNEYYAGRLGKREPFDAWPAVQAVRSLSRFDEAMGGVSAEDALSIRKEIADSLLVAAKSDLSQLRAVASAAYEALADLLERTPIVRPHGASIAQEDLLELRMDLVRGLTSVLVAQARSPELLSRFAVIFGQARLSALERAEADELLQSHEAVQSALCLALLDSQATLLK
jgi:hypothetical protein